MIGSTPDEFHLDDCGEDSLIALICSSAEMGCENFGDAATPDDSPPSGFDDELTYNVITCSFRARSLQHNR